MCFGRAAEGFSFWGETGRGPGRGVILAESRWKSHSREAPGAKSGKVFGVCGPGEEELLYHGAAGVPTGRAG